MLNGEASLNGHPISKRLINPILHLLRGGSPSSFSFFGSDDVGKRGIEEGKVVNFHPIEARRIGETDTPADEV